MKAKPFLKWVGGKAKLLPVYLNLGIYPPPGFEKEKNTYFEPFLGGGAMFFDLQPKKAVLSDANYELITAWKMVKNSWMDVVDMTGKDTGKQEYYRTREVFNKGIVPVFYRGALFIYLNKTCYRGLWRVNSKGEFNVPYGHYKNPSLFSEENIRACSQALQHAVVQSLPFEYSAIEAEKGDFVYFDPPYHPISKTADFTGYTAEGFGEEDQIRLKNMFEVLTERGCYVMLSNSDTGFIRGLYKDLPGVNIYRVSARRPISNGKAGELVITNYEGKGL